MLKLINNLYGLKNYGRVWNKYLTDNIITISFKKKIHLQVCLLPRTCHLCILRGRWHLHKSLQTLILSSNQGRTIDRIRYWGQGRCIRLPWCEWWEYKRQTNQGLAPSYNPYIIDQAHIPKNATTRHTLALATKVIRRNGVAPKFNIRFHYCGAIVRLNFLEKRTHPYIVYATN